MEDEKKTKKQLIEELQCLRLEQIEQTRITSEKFTKAFIQSSIPTIITSAKDGRAVEVSDSFLRLVGLKRHEVIGRTMIENKFITREQRAIFFDEFKKNGCIKDLEMEITPQDRGLKYALFNAVILSINNENYLQVTLQPITDRKQAEKALRDSEEKFRVLFNSGKDFMAVHLTGKDGMPTKFVLVNDATCELLGYTREEMLQLKPQDIDSTSSSGLVPAIIEKFIQNKYILFETEMMAKNGQRIPMEVSLTLFQLQDSEATLCVARDLTERNRTAEEIRKSNMLLNAIIENIPSTIFLKDAKDLRFLLFNKAAENLAGYSSDDVMGKNDYDFLPKEQADFFTDKDRDVLRGTNVVDIPEEPLQTRNKGQRILHTRKVPIFNTKGEPEYLLGISEDITERKKVEEELAKSQAKYRVITENIMDCIFLIDASGVFQYATNCKEILGYELEDLIGITGMSITHPEELERIQRIYEGGVDGNWKEITYQTRLRHKEGHYVPMEIRGRTFADPSGKISGAVFAGREIISDQQKKKRRSAKKSASTQPYLNSREKEILQWLMQGKSTCDISKILDIGEPTIKYHVDKVMKKLSAVNRTHAVVIALQSELLN